MENHKFTSDSPSERLRKLLARRNVAGGGGVSALLERLRMDAGREPSMGPAGKFSPKNLRLKNIANTGRPENLTSKLGKPPEGR